MFTQKQVAALKYVIYNGAKGKTKDDLAVRIAYFLIQNSNFLNGNVCLTMHPDENLTTQEITELAVFLGHGSMMNLTEIFRAMGSKTHISAANGGYDQKLGTWNLYPFPYVEGEGKCPSTFWLAPNYYDHAARRLVYDYKTLMSIDLDPGLYNLTGKETAVVEEPKVLTPPAFADAMYFNKNVWPLFREQYSAGAFELDAALNFLNVTKKTLDKL